MQSLAERMALIGQAFLHASLLGTEAEATRLREIKAEVFRQQQQRRAAAGGEIGEFSTCRSRHIFHGLQLRFGSSSTHLLQLSCPSFHHTRHMLHGLQHRLGCRTWRLLQGSMAPEASVVMGMLHELQYWWPGPGHCDAFPGQPHASWKHHSLDGPHSSCTLLSSQAAIQSALICFTCRQGRWA